MAKDQIDRQDVRVAKEVFLRLLPASKPRAIFELVAETIRIAHEAAPSCWSVTLTSKMFRLNVGPVEVCTFVVDAPLHFVVRRPLPRKLPPGVSLARSSGPHVYKTVPVDSVSMEVTHKATWPLPMSLVNAHHAYVREAASRQHKTSFRRAFSVGVLLYLEAILGEKLPRPGFFDNLESGLPARSADEVIGESKGKTPRDLIFLSYSHADTPWLTRLKTHLKPFERNRTIELWDDQRIQTGAQWRDEIATALERARVAVLLVSPDFIASDFIAAHELPNLLNTRKDVTVVWIPIRPSNYSATEVRKYQAALDPARSLAEMSAAEADRALVVVAEKIHRAFTQRR